MTITKAFRFLAKQMDTKEKNTKVGICTLIRRLHATGEITREQRRIMSKIVMRDVDSQTYYCSYFKPLPHTPSGIKYRVLYLLFCAESWRG